MNATLQREYFKMRTHKPFVLVGRDAECSLDAARSVLAFRELEADGRARIVAEPDAMPYDFGDMECTDAEKERILSDGVWNVSVQVWRGCCECGRGEWETVDCICGNAGYSDPCSPYENCYVPDMMRAAVDAVQE
jgi:hypothetical protein